MSWDVEYTDEFEKWWDGFTENEQTSIASTIGLLEEMGPRLPHPHSSDVRSSKHGQMRELRIQHGGNPYRILYAFDPRRSAILLVGGCKAGNNRWYDQHVPIADKLYDEHIETLKREGLTNG